MTHAWSASATPAPAMGPSQKLSPTSTLRSTLTRVQQCLFEHLVHKTMLDVDAPGAGAFEVPHQLRKRRQVLEGVSCQHFQQFLRFFFQAGSGQLLGVLEHVLGEDDRPLHQRSSLALLSRGSAMPFLMDSRIPGMASR